MNTNREADKVESLNALPYFVKQAEEATGRLYSHVRIAKLSGATWAEIGAVLGVSRQAAQQKYSTDYDEPMTAADVAGPSVTSSVLVEQTAPASQPERK